MRNIQETQISGAEAGAGLSIRRYFTTPETHPFDAIEWETRDARIGHGDKVAFEQQDVEFPKSWSQNATNIVAQKYFRGQLESPARERSVKQMIGRVAGTIAGWGRERGYFATDEDADTFEAELIHILLHQLAAFNSPVWFNVGFEESPQCSACFILSVEDEMESILGWNTKAQEHGLAPWSAAFGGGREARASARPDRAGADGRRDLEIRRARPPR